MGDGSTSAPDSGPRRFPAAISSISQALLLPADQREGISSTYGRPTGPMTTAVGDDRPFTSMWPSAGPSSGRSRKEGVGGGSRGGLHRSSSFESPGNPHAELNSPPSLDTLRLFSPSSLSAALTMAESPAGPSRDQELHDISMSYPASGAIPPAPLVGAPPDLSALMSSVSPLSQIAAMGSRGTELGMPAPSTVTTSSAGPPAPTSWNATGISPADLQRGLGFGRGDRLATMPEDEVVDSPSPSSAQALSSSLATSRRYSPGHTSPSLRPLTGTSPTSPRRHQGISRRMPSKLARPSRSASMSSGPSSSSRVSSSSSDVSSASGLPGDPTPHSPPPASRRRATTLSSDSSLSNPRLGLADGQGDDGDASRTSVEQPDLATTQLLLQVLDSQFPDGFPLDAAFADQLGAIRSDDELARIVSNMISEAEFHYGFPALSGAGVSPHEGGGGGGAATVADLDLDLGGDDGNRVVGATEPAGVPAVWTEYSEETGSPEDEDLTPLSSPRTSLSWPVGPLPMTPTTTSSRRGGDTGRESVVAGSSLSADQVRTWPRTNAAAANTQGHGRSLAGSTRRSISSGNTPPPPLSPSDQYGGGMDLSGGGGGGLDAWEPWALDSSQQTGPTALMSTPVSAGARSSSQPTTVSLAQLEGSPQRQVDVGASSSSSDVRGVRVPGNRSVRSGSSIVSSAPSFLFASNEHSAQSSFTSGDSSLASRLRTPSSSLALHEESRRTMLDGNHRRIRKPPPKSDAHVTYDEVTRALHTLHSFLSQDRRRATSASSSASSRSHRTTSSSVSTSFSTNSSVLRRPPPLAPPQTPQAGAGAGAAVEGMSSSSSSSHGGGTLCPFPDDEQGHESVESLAVVSDLQDRLGRLQKEKRERRERKAAARRANATAYADPKAASASGMARDA